MPGSAVVSSVPDGSSRSAEWRMMVFHSPGGPLVGVERGGNSVSVFPGSSNWGLGGEQPAFVNYREMAMVRIRQGAQQFGWNFNWVTRQPQSPTNFEWLDGLTVIEGIFAWPTDTAGVDNGIQIVSNNFQRVITQAQAGFEIWNDNGQLKLTVQSTGTNTVLLNPGASIREPMKIRMEMRSATKNRVASLAVFVNDIQQARVTGSTIPPNVNASSGFFCNVGVLSAVSYMYFRDLRMFVGPDTSIGM